MKCPECHESISFWEWFKYEYKCKKCFNSDKKELERKVKIESDKKELKTKKEREASKGNYKYALVIIGIILVCIASYMMFISDSTYYNTITKEKYTLSEVKNDCDNPFVEFFGVKTDSICRSVKTTYVRYLGLMIIGILLLIIGIIKNLMIYNYNLNK